MLLPRCEKSGWKNFLLRCLLIAGQLLDVFGTRCDWLVSRHGLKIRVRGGSSLENSEAEILVNGLVRLERRRKIKNVNEVTFLDLVCLTLLLKKEMGSLSRIVRSEMVGLVAGSNLEEMASSEHLKTQKPKMNMVSSVRAVLGVW